MSAVDDLLVSLDAGNFDSAIDGCLGSLDKAALLQLMAEMEGKSASIPDADKRHLFKNGIASIQMMTGAM